MSNNEEKFHMAVREDDRSTAEKLLNRGVNVDCVYYGMTPLLVAITKGHTETAGWLIDHKCNVRHVDVQGASPLEEALHRDLVQVVKKLGRAGVELSKPMKSGETGLTFAAKKNMTLMTQALIEGGADGNLLNTPGESPLYIAARLGHRGVSELLLKAGVKKDHSFGEEKQTPLIAAVANDQLSTAILLIKSGCNLNLSDGGGWTALWHAVSDSNQPLVRALVQAGADVNVTDSDGRTVIQEAMDNEMEEIVDILHLVKR